MAPVHFEIGPSSEVTETVPALNLLAHAQILECSIGSRCGGHGKCGGDRLRVLKGGPYLSAITEHEREHLTPEEIAEGYRLGCQAFPTRRSDLIVVRAMPKAPG